MSAWARRFISEEDGEAAQTPPNATEQLIGMQQAARVSLVHWSRISARYALGFAIFLALALTWIAPAWLRDVAFVLALVYGSLAISRYMKVAQCRMEIAAHIEEFVD
ncbi:MAG: hypothetical protein KGL35_11605 [Bradyrhizobium sp.]|nr:hypothetical protein [Bradyrhizobium sp.]